MNKKIKAIKDLSIITLVGSTAIIGMANLITNVPEYYYNSFVKNQVTMMKLIDQDSSKDYSSDEIEYLAKILESCDIPYEIHGDSISFNHRNKNLKKVIKVYQGENEE